MGLFDGVSIRTPLGRNSDISNLGKNVTREISGAVDNFNRGDIGKWTSNYADSFVNVALAVPRAIISGDVKKEVQRLSGGVVNLMTVGAAGYVGSNKGTQRVLESKFADTATLGLSSDFAGVSRGSVSLQEGKLSQGDRDDMFRYFGKLAAIGGGVGLYEYLTTPQAGALAAEGQATGAVLVEGGPVITPDVVTSANTSTWADGALSSVLSGGEKVASAAGVAADVGTKAYLVKSIIDGKVPAGQGTDILFGGDGSNGGGNFSWLDDLFGGLFGPGGSPSGPGTGTTYIPEYIEAPENKVLPVLAIGAVGIGAYFLYKKVM